MRRARVVSILAAPLLFAIPAAVPAEGQPLAGTAPLEWEGDLSARMVEGIDRFLLLETERSIAARASRWQRDRSSPAAYAASVAANRERFRKRLGAVDARLAPDAL